MNNMPFSLDELRSKITYCPISGEIKTISEKYKRKNRQRHAGIKTNASGKSYIRLTIFNKLYYAHRVAWFYYYGVWPEYIDHIDGNGLNNAISNLRSVSRSENQKNQRLHKKNNSGVSGVIYRERINRYEAYINVDLTNVYLGVYKTIFDAACARKAAENRYGFHENHGSDRPL